MEDKIIKAERIVQLNKDIKSLSEFKNRPKYWDKGSEPCTHFVLRDGESICIDGIQISIRIDKDSNHSQYLLNSINQIVDDILSAMKQELETLIL